MYGHAYYVNCAGDDAARVCNPKPLYHSSERTLIKACKILPTKWWLHIDYCHMISLDQSFINTRLSNLRPVFFTSCCVLHMYFNELKQATQ